MSKKNKKNKKNNIKPEKTKQQRKQEIIIIIEKLTNLGLTCENPDIQYAIQQMNNFIENGHSLTENIKINGYKRVLELILSKRPHIQSSANLKYNPEI